MNVNVKWFMEGNAEVCIIDCTIYTIRLENGLWRIESRRGTNPQMTIVGDTKRQAKARFWWWIQKRNKRSK